MIGCDAEGGGVERVEARGGEGGFIGVDGSWGACGVG